MSRDPLKLLPFDVAKVRGQDVVVVVAVLAATFLFRAPNVWELKPSWQLYITSDASQTPGRNNLPLPIVTDLDSDGLNEVITTMMDSKIQILVLPPQKEEDDLTSTLPHLHVKAEAVLRSHNLSTSAFPVALGAGCDQRITNSLDICRQIIVVVTNNGVVHCFTDQLELLWTADTFKDQSPSDSHYYFKEIAVHIVPYSPDFGLVLIGGKLVKDKPPEEHMKHSHHLNMSDGRSADEVAKLPPRRVRPAKMSSEEKEHFSTYALNSKTGQIHWKHEPGDYEAKKSSREDLLSAYHFKLALHSSQYHVGEVHWSIYTDSLIATLPYRWQHPADTNLQTAHFVKRSPSSSTEMKDKGTSEKFQPHAGEGKPNAVIIHQHKSIEVLNLDSGQPLCTYPISKDRTSVGDVNDDDVIDHVTVFFSSEPVPQPDIIPCSALVTSGAKNLFRGSICRPSSTFGSYFTSTTEEDFHYEPVPVAPLLMPSPSDRKGIFGHLSGNKFKRERIRGFDSVFVISSGRLTSFGPYGEFNWQTDTGNSWEKKTTGEGYETEVFVPNIQAVSTLVEGGKDAVLVTGWKSLTLVSLKDGAVLAAHSVPCVSVSPATLGDFSNDGLTDFVVRCEKSYLGFSLESKPGYWWTVVSIACGLGTILAAVLILRVIEEVIA